ncbi:hypothetical protein DFH11DRAFT_220480 [Phellopilus nigrolimitatus]|nr:hypothetical protein DFH11DRAFT_220480 [Phellopilus nigrolimitatus]
MCLGNRAESSSHYINSQLGALYENAQKCTEKHGTGFKPTMSAVEYGTCLFEFYGPGKHSRYQPSRLDLPFFAKFGRPRIEFVCNHEVILFLDLQEGHYNLDITKISPKQELHETIEACTIAFRIAFSTQAIENIRCSAIGNSEDYTVILHVLDMNSAVFEPDLSELPDTTTAADGRGLFAGERKLNALTHYLAKFYLQTLKRAGHHVLHSLPDFDNLSSTTAHIDYSVISQSTLSTDSLFGISINDINTFLRGLWLQAAAFIDEHGLSQDTITQSFLAELRVPAADALDDMNLHLYFGPLHIQPLCKREIVLYLNIQDIHVGPFNEEPIHKLTDWKFAFIVDIIDEVTDEGSIKRIRLDLTTARFCEHLSVFGEYDDVDVLVRVKSILVRYITMYYLAILEASETTVIFQHDKRVHVEVDDQAEPGDDGEHGQGVDDNDFHVHDCTCPDETMCGHTGGVRWGVIQKRILSHTQSEGFDLITAVTQGAINAHFKALWEAARRALNSNAGPTWESPEREAETCLADFAFVHPDHGDEVFFASSFGPPKLQLVCREDSCSVILYLHIVEGYMKTLGTGKSLQPGSEPYSFSHWRLAFEIDLKLDESTEDTISEAILKRLGRQDSSGLNQLTLDLSTTRFNLSLSTIPGLLDGTDYRAIRARREALVYYTQMCYFPAFKRARHQVLYTIPTRVKNDHDNQLHTLTSLKFQIAPFSYETDAKPIEGLYGRYRAIFERNAILIRGMTDGRPLPTHPLPRNVNWISGVGKEVPYGTVCLSRKTFLEARLLALLERFNRDTTIVPSFSGVDSGEWILKLTTWSKHGTKKNYGCKWREIPTTSDESLDFEWRNRDEWRYEYEGDFEGNGLYTVNCRTRNVLSIPTSRSDKFIISIKGMMRLGLSYVGESKDWNAEMHANWSANIVFSSDASGLQIRLSSAQIVPQIRSSHFAPGAPGESTHAKIFKHLRDEFPSTVDFEGLMSELRATFEGAWSGLLVHAHELVIACPVFNRHGDLMFELSVRGPSIEGIPARNGGLRGNQAGVLGQAAANTNGKVNGNSNKGGWFHNVVQSIVSKPITQHTQFRASHTTKSGAVTNHPVTQQPSPVTEVEDFPESEINTDSDEEEL